VTTLASDIISDLRTATMPAHEVLDQLIMTADPFASRQQYARLLTMQYCLQRDFEPLYDDAELTAIIPQLKTRSRQSLVEQDMADLELALPATEVTAPQLGEKKLPEKLGWLFVLEGSRLGAMSLLRRAAALGLSGEFGARHLAGDGSVPAERWKSLVQTISGLPLDESERKEAAAGAQAAFEHATALARKYVATERHA
jgi:heme oxygenase